MIQPWHVYVAFVLITWLCAATVIFANRLLPVLNDIGLFLIIGGGLITIIVVAAMPKVHASSQSVWSGSAFSANNLSGWSNGVAFLTGVLNGAFTIGTPDAVTHIAEELPNPSRDMPRAVAAQMTLGTLSRSAPESYSHECELTFVTHISIFLLRSCHLLRRHRSVCDYFIQRLLSPRCHLRTSDRFKRRHIRPPPYNPPLDPDLRAWHLPYSLSYLLGSGSR